MKIITNPVKQKLTLIFLSFFIVSLNPAVANSDKDIMADVQKARALTRGGGQAKHYKLIDEKQKFRGIFFGYLPCDHCAGIKMTLSLKDKNNYLLVTQYAQASNREFYEKGKYNWDEKSRTVTLTSRKDSKVQKLQIKNADTLIMLSPEGKPMKGDQDDYALLSSDTKKSREVHIH